MPRSFLAAAVGVALVAAAVLAAPPASAEPYVVVAPEAWIVIPADREVIAAGTGGTLIAGWGLDFDPLLIGPQVALGAYVLPNSGRSLAPSPGNFEGDERSAPDDTQSMFRATVGGALGIAGPVEASLYLRAGIARSDARFATEGPMGVATNPSASGGVAIDAGFSGDVRLSRDVTLGLQLGYAGFVAVGGTSGDLHAIALGPRLGFWF